MKTNPRNVSVLKLGFFFGGAMMAFVKIAAAAPGDLDLTFGGTGKVTTPIGSSYDIINSIAIQSDGRIVVAGRANVGSDVDFALARYNSNGTLDANFGSNGKVTTNFSGGVDYANGIALQSDGKIVAAGLVSLGSLQFFGLARYNANGTLDASFNTTGMVTTAVGVGASATNLAVQTDGKIVVCGYSFSSASKANFTVVRYNANGTLDTGFNGTGKITTAIGNSQDNANSMTLQNDGKILLAGISLASGNEVNIAVVRYNTNGSLDTSFNGSGKVVTRMALS